METPELDSDKCRVQQFSAWTIQVRSRPQQISYSNLSDTSWALPA